MQFQCRSHSALCRGLERSISERHGRDMVVAWSWHGSGMVVERQGNGMVCELAFNNAPGLYSENTRVEFQYVPE
jgi:hypothetical protein